MPGNCAIEKLPEQRREFLCVDPDLRMFLENLRDLLE
jgi:hypothetical protein